MDPQRLVSGAQGTIGIVTWMSLKCRFLSELSRAFLIPSPTLEPLIELSYKLTRIRFTGNIFILNGLNLACLLQRTPPEIEALNSNLPSWVMFASCEAYGPLPEEKMQYLEEDLKELADACGLPVAAALDGVRAEDLAALLALPSPDPYWKQRLKGGFSELFFLTTQGKTPEFTRLIAKIAQQQEYPTDNTGIYIQPIVLGTSCHCEFDFYYDPNDRVETEKTRKLVSEAAHKTEIEGAFFSRPYGIWADMAYGRDAQTTMVLRKAKDIFDPNHVMNPGKLCFQSSKGGTK